VREFLSSPFSSFSSRLRARPGERPFFPIPTGFTTNSFLLYSVGPDGKDDQGTPLKRVNPELGDMLPSTFPTD